MRHILLLQKPERVDSQRAAILSNLDELGATVEIADSPDRAAQYSETSVLIAPILPWLPDVLAVLPRVEWIHFLSAGVDRIWDMNFDKTRFRLSKSVGVHAATISEYTLGAILYALKAFGTFARQQRNRVWHRFWLDECRGKTLGIIGLGTIGANLARYASALGMHVIGTVTTPRTIENVDEVFSADQLHEVLIQSDFVVLLVPLTADTRQLINASALAAMKREAWLINVARGEIVDQRALIDALGSGVIAGAILDVFEDEPLPPDSPLWDMDNVLITPHVAGTTQHYMQRALEVFKANYNSLVSTGELLTPVSVEKGY